MASGLLILLDDIASVLDDVAFLTKVATKKTAGVLGDDLALNAQQVTGVTPNRELPVVWAVAKGSLVNKAILVPAAVLLSTFAPWSITPLMILGGTFLCFEGCEKLVHKFLHSKHEQEENHEKLIKAVADETVDIVAFEKDKVRGAIRTDFILSAEIIVITLGTVADTAFGTRIGVLVAVSLIMTVGVYGLVAGIVKLDDLGAKLLSDKDADSVSSMKRSLGRSILFSAPYLMKFLSIAGTVAMFLVGGGILIHGIPWLHHRTEDLIHAIGEWPSVGGIASGTASLVLNGLVGLIAGAVVVAIVTAIAKLRGKQQPSHA